MSNFIPINSDFTVDGVIASFKNLVAKRHEFFRNLAVFVNLIPRFNDKVVLEIRIYRFKQTQWFLNIFIMNNF